MENNLIDQEVSHVATTESHEAETHTNASEATPEASFEEEASHGPEVESD